MLYGITGGITLLLLLFGVGTGAHKLHNSQSHQSHHPVHHVGGSCRPH